MGFLPGGRSTGTRAFGVVAAVEFHSIRNAEELKALPRDYDARAGM